MNNNFLIILKTNKKNLLKIYLAFIKNIFIKLNIKYKISQLPRKFKRITILKSPHVYKKAREQFEIRTFSSIIKIYNYNMSFNFLNFFSLNKPNNIKFLLRKIA